MGFNLEAPNSDLYEIIGGSEACLEVIKAWLGTTEAWLEALIAMAIGRTAIT